MDAGPLPVAAHKLGQPLANSFTNSNFSRPKTRRTMDAHPAGGGDGNNQASETKMHGDSRSCVAEIRKGLQTLWKWVGITEGACRIVNKTGKPVVVRTKYKDVWEGQGWRLAAKDGEMVVPDGLLKSAQPYCRLVAFMEGDDAAAGVMKLSDSAPLYITCRDLLGAPRKIVLSLGPHHLLRVT